MKFYAYQGTKPLGEEPLGTFGKLLFELKTVRGAHKRAKVAFSGRPYRIYTYSHFYDKSTFKQV